MPTSSSSRGILLSGDLFFASRVTGTATALGGQVLVAENVEALSALLEEAAPALLLIDLNVPGLAVADAMGRLPEGEDRPHVIAFGSHVDVPRLNEARAAGCDEVLPRSRFTSTLAELLRTHLVG